MKTIDATDNTEMRETFRELMTRYNEYRTLFENRFGVEFDEEQFHDWFSHQATR